jgi:hypothetical protein
MSCAAPPQHLVTFSPGGDDVGTAAVLLVALAPYHLDEMVPLAGALAGRGIGTTLTTVQPARKPLARFRTQTRLYDALVGALESRGWRPGPRAVPAADAIAAHHALVVMNDWDHLRLLVAYAQSRGIPTFGKVEGVQDFADVDTGRDRRAYRTVDHVLLQGANDRAALAGRPGTIVGTCRLERLLAEPVQSTRTDLVVVNCNFTYGVLTEHRRAWLRSVVDACRRASRPFVVSRHIADRGWVNPRLVSRRPVGELLDEAGVLVTRFSTLGFEALARGVELVYHNPYGERVPAFQRPDGAFAVTRSVDELAASLARPVATAAAVRENARAFLAAQVDIDPQMPSEERAADVIVRMTRE